MGQTHFSKSTEINAPAGSAWNVMIDVEHWADWTPSITRIKVLTAGPFGAGSRARVHQPKLPPAFWKVTEWNPGRNFVWISTAPGVRVTANHAVESINTGCKVTLSIQYEGLFGPLFARWTSELNERYLEMEANGLKSLLEKRPFPKS